MNTTNIRNLRKNPTPAEHLLWKRLRLRQMDGHKFRRQHPIGPYIVDFVCLEQKVIIEIDGGQHLENEKDDQRTDWLEKRGYRVLRFWNNEVLKDIEAVGEAIYRWILHPPPQSSPSRGEDV